MCDNDVKQDRVSKNKVLGRSAYFTYFNIMCCRNLQFASVVIFLLLEQLITVNRQVDKQKG